jgi:PAS domain S-box-containing protein
VDHLSFKTSNRPTVRFPLANDQERGPASSVASLADVEADSRRAARPADKAETTALANSEERFRLLVESVKDYAILMLDPEGLVTTWNKGAEFINGYRSDEIIGRHFSHVYRQEDVVQGRPEHELAVAAAEGRFADEGWLVRKDGTSFWAEVVITPIYDDSGKLSGFSKVVRDVSVRKEAEKHLAQMEGRYRGLLEAAPDAMVVVNPGGEIVLLNLQAEKQFGYRRDELLGQKVTNIIPDGFAARLIADDLRSAEDALAQQIGTGIELTGRRKDRGEFPIEIMLSPLESTEGTLVTAAIRDITERKRFESTLREKNIQLQTAVNELDAFSYSVSHDLRAPLRAIDGFSQILLKQYGPILSEEPREYLQLVRDNSRQMGHLVDDLLAFSRLGRTPLSKRQVPTETMVKQVLRDVGQQAEGRSVSVSVGHLPPVWGDGTLLKQVFMNLINNAFKYTRLRDDATVEIGSHNTDGEQVFFVRDNGAGFDMQYADKLFGVFQRLHRAEEFEGTGVGLAIVQRIIQRHGGRVWAEAAIDKGATFFFTTGGSKS